MLIKLLKNIYFSPVKATPSGTELEVNEIVAKSLIAKGYAVEVKTEIPLVKIEAEEDLETPVEVVKPKRYRTKKVETPSEDV